MEIISFITAASLVTCSMASLMDSKDQNQPKDPLVIPSNILKPTIKTNKTFDKVHAMELTQSFMESFCLQVNIPVCACAPSNSKQSCEITVYVHDNITDTQPTIESTTKYQRNEATLVYASVTMVSSLFGVIGNACVLVIAYRNRSNLPPCKLHIAQLAGLNLVFCVVQMVVTLPLYWTNVWLYDIFMCKVLRTFMEGASLLTLCFIFVIAVERHLLIMYPMKCRLHEFQSTVSFLLVLVSLMVSVTIVPYFTGLSLEDGTGRCVMFANGLRHMLLPYNVLVVVLYSIIPLCLIGTLNVRMSQYLSKSPKCELIRDESERRKRCKNNRRIRNSNIFIMTAFILCTLPSRSILTYIALMDFKMADMDVYMTLAFISYVTYPLQSVLNPILYSMVAKEWRREIVRIFRRTVTYSLPHSNSSGSLMSRRSIKRERNSFCRRLEKSRETIL